MEVAIQLFGKIQEVAPEAEEIDGFTLIALHPEIEKRLREQGYKRVHVTMHPTNLDYERLQSIQEYFRSKSQADPLREISICRTKRCRAFIPVISPHFHDSFQFSSDSGSHLISGRYAILFVASRDPQVDENWLELELTDFLLELNWVFGLPTALPSSLSWEIDLSCEETRTSLRSNPLFVYPELAGCGVDASVDSEVGPLDATDCLTLSREQKMILRQAINSKMGWERFLYFWIFIEMRIGASSRRRENFMLNELKSMEINLEAKRLANVRAKIVHDGHMDVSQRDSESVLWMARLLSLQVKSHQERLMKRYAQWIREGEG